MNPSDTDARAHGACAVLRLAQSDGEIRVRRAPVNPLDGVPGVDLADLLRFVELLTRLERDGWLDEAIARFERGDIEGGWRAHEAASRAAQVAFAGMLNSGEDDR